MSRSGRQRRRQRWLVADLNPTKQRTSPAAAGLVHTL
jgi:hypothetical protein